MMTLFSSDPGRGPDGSIPGRYAQGTVVDDQGKPVAGAAGCLLCSGTFGKQGGTVEVRATTDAQGRFRLTSRRYAGSLTSCVPSLGLSPRLGAIAATWSRQSCLRRWSCKSRSRRPSRSKGPTVSPSPGRGSLRESFRSPRRDAAGHARVAGRPLAVTTGPDGKAMLDYLAAGDQLLAVRVAAESIGTQDFQLVDGPAATARAPTITIRLKQDEPAGRPCPKPCGRAGRGTRLSRSGSRGAPGWNRIRSGSRTGRSARVLTARSRLPTTCWSARPIGSWFAHRGRSRSCRTGSRSASKPRVLLPMIQRPLRTISGQRRGSAGQAGGRHRGLPIGRRAGTDGDPDRCGRPVRAGRAFARDRFSSSLAVKGFGFPDDWSSPANGDITVELTRTSERPAHEMRMLPEVIPPGGVAGPGAAIAGAVLECL